MEERKYNEADDIYSKILRAGRRTYFFDVRSTKAGDYYLTISESKKFTNEDGSFYALLQRMCKGKVKNEVKIMQDKLNEVNDQSLNPFVNETFLNVAIDPFAILFSTLMLSLIINFRPT